MEQKRYAEMSGGEFGYSWLYKATARNGAGRVLVVLLVTGLGAGFTFWWSRTGHDTSPDSLFGISYAIFGTLMLLLAATLFSLRRRSHHRRDVGGLRASLGWHMCFGMIGLAFLIMHSAGELNPRTGTYALYGMIALVISGLIGRFLDRLMPRMTAGAVHKALTLEGEDRLETISEQLQAIVVHHTQHLHSFSASRSSADTPSQSNLPVPIPTRQPERQQWRAQSLHMPWDMSYISLESTPQELNRANGQHRFVPDKKSSLMQPGALMPGSQEQINALEEVQQAMRSELYYRYIVRYWRRFHILLALVTLGLLTWHIVYALQLTLPVMFPKLFH